MFKPQKLIEKNSVVYPGKIEFITAVKVTYTDYGFLSADDISMCFNFAYDMTFGGNGEHRNHRSGGQHNRRNGEIFANTMLGKMCEFALYNELKNSHKINEPDLKTAPLGVWDTFDFKVDEKIVSVKSTKSYGQLLLLEKKDWNSNGVYLPNNERYDYTFVIRIKNDPESIMKKHKKFYIDSIDRNELWSFFASEKIGYDVPRYILNNELCHLIRNNFSIKQGELLNGSTTMDADNYYCHLANMHEIKKGV